MELIQTFSGPEEINFDKIKAYISNLKTKYNLKNISTFRLSKMIINDILVENITTSELNIETCKLCIGLSYKDDYDYYKLAGIIYCENLHKNTYDSIKKLYKEIYEFNPSLLNEGFIKYIEYNSKSLQSMIKYDRDYNYDYFGLTTLDKGYLIKIKNNVSERPQQMLLRVAVQIHFQEDVDSDTKLRNIQNTYDDLSNHYYTHATPTLFNAGYKRNQLSSCFLLGNLEDSIDAIYGKTLLDSALISKNSGGIGIALHAIRASNTYIKGTNGISNGIIPMMKVFEATAKYVDQGGGKRNGSIAFFLEPWHADIFDFLNAKRPSGDESLKIRDLFFALWIPDLFMKKLKNNEKWSLFCPHKCPGLDTTYGEKFEELYEYYESNHMYNRQVDIYELFYLICDTLIETGTPYILFKDNVNNYSNQKNIGVIRSSNLCCEIMEYSDPNETAVCNLASINLTSFVNEDNTYDYNNLHRIAYECTVNLNKLIDVTYYPTDSCEVSNMRHRPIAVGVQGLANVFYLLKLTVGSIESRIMNDNIFETIYHGCLSASIDLAKKYGPYKSFSGSPFSEGKFQFDLLGKSVKDLNGTEEKKKALWDWESLRKDMINYGTRNSLLTAVMPTASTSQILGNYESIEFPQTNVFVRTTKAGKFPILNKYLIDDLKERELWSHELQRNLINVRGDVKDINDIPYDIKKLYSTIWDIPQKNIIDMSIDRQKYIDQSQSLNIYYNPSSDNIYDKLMSVMMYGWKNKLKTGIYYLRTKPASYALNFTDNNECTVCSS